MVTLSATSLKFGTIEAGTMSPVQVVTLTNTGNAVLTITQLSAASAYHLFNDGCTTVAAGDSCTFGVSFEPMAAGKYASAVTIADNASGSPQKVGLSGTATAPVVGLSPNTLSFGVQAVGTTSAVQVSPSPTKAPARLRLPASLRAAILPKPIVARRRLRRARVARSVLLFRRLLEALEGAVSPLTRLATARRMSA